MLAATLRRLRDGILGTPSDSVVTVTLGGHGYRFAEAYGNPLLAEARQSASYEPWFKATLRRLLSRRKGAVVDVGANIGQTMLAVLTVDPARRYIGFEPQIRCCQSIQGFIDENGLDHYTILPVGLADRTGVLSLNSRKLHDKSASIVAEYRPEGFHPNRTHVAVMTGDEVMMAVDPGDIAVIKIDVEGGELAVLRGFSETLRTRRPAIIFELLPNFLLITGERLDRKTLDFRARMHADMFAELSDRQYDLFLVGEDGGLQEVRELAADERRIRNCLAIAREERDSILAGA